MIQVSNNTIESAFEAYLSCYAAGRNWNVRKQLALYDIAEKALSPPGSSTDFSAVYRSLSGGWQVFRNAQSHWSAQEAFGNLMRLDQGIRTLSLSNLKDNDWPDIWKTVSAMRDIKTNKSGMPSLVAISKFLHFWNPRLFVILDSEVMQYHVLGHKWIELPASDHLCQLCSIDSFDDPTLAHYICFLKYGTQFMKANQHVRAAFTEAARSAAGTAVVPADFETYDAVAFEWCILGLVELPPAGVVTPARSS